MHELRLLCPEDRIELVSDALEALDALSVSVEDADAQTDAEHALFGEPGMPAPKEGWQRSRVLALFTTQGAAQEAADTLGAQDFFDTCRVLGLIQVPELDWVRLTQAQFAPVEITSSFWIVPTWHEPPVSAKTVLRLDPGLAFGTGTHPTTRMCLRWIDRHAAAVQHGRVLDYGCGSGILAMGAAKYGAQSVDAVDIDPAAVAATELNAQANHVSLAAVGLPEVANGPYQTVLANILATPLKVLAPLLCSYVGSGGHLVLAGILSRQTDELRIAYKPFADLQISDEDDGWALMTARL